jgi:flagellar assembly factor FliW
VMKRPILGFEQCSRFVLLLDEENSPLRWFQAIDDPGLAFVVVNPLVFKNDYNPSIFQELLDLLKITDSEEMVLLVIVTVRAQPVRITANLRAPILINAQNRSAAQIVLDNPDYPLQYDLLAPQVDCSPGVTTAGGGTDASAKLSLVTTPC